ncbi:MAG: hypothetical protein WBD22_06230 [Pyrinomonadaceae bacterium]
MARIETALSAAIEIISKTETGRALQESYSDDEVNVHFTTTIKALKNLNCFSKSNEFFEVFAQAIDLVNKYDGTPETLHLYLNELTLPFGQTLEDPQLRFLYLTVFRWFTQYGKYVNKLTRSHEPEWERALESCTPCPCDYTATDCECEKVRRMHEGRYDDADEETCACHMWPDRNLGRLIYPFNEIRDFDYLKRRLELLPNNHERLKLLIEEKAAYDQDFSGQDSDPPSFENAWDIGFSEKCRIEIEKLKSLEDLKPKLVGNEPEPNAAIDAMNDEYDPAKRGVNRRRAMMLIDILVPNLNNTQKSEILFLTFGYNAESARKFWSTYLSDRPLDKRSEDEEIIKKWTLQIGLH